jgi:putative Ca2+/H+ antiporter (TMEM165/GDT1 family)
MMGLVLPSILPKQYTHIIGGILFLYFGIKLIYDSRSMSDKVSDELEEVEEELLQHNKKDDEADIESSPTGGNVNSNSTTKPTSPTSSSAGESDNKKILMQSFLLTFLAEWGDRSQIATIALAAAKNPYGVTIGGCIGHSLCTGLAVIGGRMLASKISEKTVSFWGGSIFLVFAIHSLFFDSAE